MNLGEIGLFQFFVFRKLPVKIIMRFGENNILCPKYIDIYEFQGGMGGACIFHCTFFVYY